MNDWLLVQTYFKIAQSKKALEMKIIIETIEFRKESVLEQSLFSFIDIFAGNICQHTA